MHCTVYCTVYCTVHCTLYSTEIQVYRHKLAYIPSQEIKEPTSFHCTILYCTVQTTDHHYIGTPLHKQYCARTVYLHILRYLYIPNSDPVWPLLDLSIRAVLTSTVSDPIGLLSVLSIKSNICIYSSRNVSFKIINLNLPKIIWTYYWTYCLDI